MQTHEIPRTIPIQRVLPLLKMVQNLIGTTPGTLDWLPGISEAVVPTLDLAKYTGDWDIKGDYVTGVTTVGVKTVITVPARKRWTVAFLEGNASVGDATVTQWIMTDARTGSQMVLKTLTAGTTDIFEPNQPLVLEAADILSLRVNAISTTSTLEIKLYAYEENSFLT